MTAALRSYLDYNATTPLLPAAEEAVRACLETFGNPSSVHMEGRRARALIEDARERIADQAGATGAQITFASGGTEANALAMRGLADAHHCRTIIASAIEHASILAHVDGQALVGSQENGLVDLNRLEDVLKSAPAPALVAIMLANNETGVLQPLPQVVAIAKKYGALVHCDAVQAFGKIPVKFANLDVDSMSLSAHKLGGLKGSGVLIVRRGLDVTPQLCGGGQERSRRAGTENLIGIVSFGAAAGEVPHLLEKAPQISNLRDDLEGRVTKTSSRARVYGKDVPRLPNTSCIALPNVSSETQVMRLDLGGVSVSAGSACSSGKITPSHVLIAMGLSPAEARSAIRISLGWASTEKDIDRFVEAWRPLALDTAA